MQMTKNQKLDDKGILVQFVSLDFVRFRGFTLSPCNRGLFKRVRAPKKERDWEVLHRTFYFVFSVSDTDERSPTFWFMHTNKLRLSKERDMQLHRSRQKSDGWVVPAAVAKPSHLSSSSLSSVHLLLISQAFHLRPMSCPPFLIHFFPVPIFGLLHQIFLFFHSYFFHCFSAPVRAYPTSQPFSSVFEPRTCIPSDFEISQRLF